jgi:hypothetical protein
VYEESVVSRIVRYPTWLLLAGLVLGVPGCSRDPYANFVAVTGTLLCDGKPAEGATVIFSPVDAPEETGRAKGNPGPASRGVVQADGTFSLITWNYRGKEQTVGALVGPHSVRVDPPMTQAPAMTVQQAGLPPKERAEVQAELDALPLFEPLECGTQVEPESIEVTSDEEKNKFEFHLEGSAPRRAPVLRTPGGRTPRPPGR